MEHGKNSKLVGFDLCGVIAGIILFALFAGIAAYLHPAVASFF